MRLGAAILAGGSATRMQGAPKGLLVVDGSPIILRTILVLRACCAEVAIVANDRAYDGLGVEVIGDDPVAAASGPLVGLLTALEHTTCDALIVTACDMPSIEPALLDLLAGTDPDADAVVPAPGGRPEPLLARYGRACAPAIRRRVLAGQRKMTCFLPDVRTVFLAEEALRACDAALRSFRNVNEPMDL